MKLTKNSQRINRWRNMGTPELAHRFVAKISGAGEHGNRPLCSLSEVTGLVVKLLRTDRSEIERIYSELKEASFASSLRRLAESNVDPNSHFGVDEALYVICRVIRPEIVVETGVFLGISSTHILCALQKNESGKLISIDLPPESTLEERGSFVPSELRDNWSFMKGSSRALLPSLVEGLAVDVFMHDSEHSESNMLFEYETVWPSIRSGGLLLSDDIDWTKAFSKFSAERKKDIAVKTSCFGYRMGALRKST